MNFEELAEVLTSMFLESGISSDVIGEILANNQHMYTNYDREAHEDQIVLNHKVLAIIEIISSDTNYEIEDSLLEKTHKRINRVLKDKY